MPQSYKDTAIEPDRGEITEAAAIEPPVPRRPGKVPPSPVHHIDPPVSNASDRWRADGWLCTDNLQTGLDTWTNRQTCSSYIENKPSSEVNGNINVLM